MPNVSNMKPTPVSNMGGLKKGGKIRKTGFYKLHSGERVVPARGDASSDGRAPDADASSQPNVSSPPRALLATIRRSTVSGAGVSVSPDAQGIGTSLSGYAPAKDGPFRCDRCRWFARDADEDLEHGDCSHPVVVADADVPHEKPDADDPSPSPVARVEAHGCCNYFRRYPAKR